MVKRAPLRPQALDQLDQGGAERVRVVLQEPRQRLLERAPAALQRQTPLEQKAADLVDQPGAHGHQSVARPMQRLYVQLRRRLDRHKAHLRSLHRLGDCLGVGQVVLVRLDERLHVLARHQPDIVALGAEDAAEMMGSGAGLHADQARPLIGQPLHQLAPVQPAPLHHLPAASIATACSTVLAKSIPIVAIIVVTPAPALLPARDPTKRPRRGGPSRYLKLAPGAMRRPGSTAMRQVRQTDARQ